MKKLFLLLAFAAGCPDESVLCLSTLTECSDGCVDLSNNDRNCGACSAQCGPSELCVMGTCATSCGGKAVACDGSCTDTASDPNHCGGCNQPCTNGTSCLAGRCQLVCAGGSTRCGDFCVDTDTDPLHCGDCNEPCPSDRVCTGGMCKLLCLGGTSPCVDRCVDTIRDPAHCGGCNMGCGPTQLCSMGDCVDVCPVGTEICAGGCVDTSSDAVHCGACGNGCGLDRICVSRACRCPDGLSFCDGRCVDLLSDPDNCNICGNGCGRYEICNGGSCECPSLLTPCSGGCVDTSTSTDHCLACDAECTNEGETCQSGGCGCPTDERLCAGACVDTDLDNLHCGGCNAPCGAAQSCVNGACVAPFTCQTNFNTPSDCPAFPLDLDMCGAPTSTSSFSMAGSLSAVTTSIAFVFSPPLMRNEAAQIQALLTAPGACCGGSIVRTSSKNNQGVIISSRNDIAPPTAIVSVSLDTIGSIFTCSHPRDLELELTSNTVLDYDATVDRISLSGNHNVGSTTASTAPALEIDPATGRTCDQVCGVVLRECGDVRQFHSLVIPPYGAADIEFWYKSASSLGTNLNLEAHRGDGAFICNAVFNRLVGLNWGTARARIVNNTATAQPIVLAPNAFGGAALSYNMSVAIEP